VQHGFGGPAIYLAGLGVLTAWYIYIKNPQIAENTRNRFAWAYTILERKYGFDEFNEAVFGGGGRALGDKLWRFGDVVFIDGLIVNGSAKLVGWFSGVARHLQTGLLYHYAFAMIIGVLMLMTIFVFIY
jgi:NADH-quinone oxidoreductase subunit L